VIFLFNQTGRAGVFAVSVWAPRIRARRGIFEVSRFGGLVTGSKKPSKGAGYLLLFCLPMGRSNQLLLPSRVWICDEGVKKKEYALGDWKLSRGVFDSKKTRRPNHFRKIPRCVCSQQTRPNPFGPPPIGANDMAEIWQRLFRVSIDDSRVDSYRIPVWYRREGGIWGDVENAQTNKHT